MNCRYCGRDCKSKISFRCHERLCKDNPNRSISNFTKYNNDVKNGDIKKEYMNQYDKAEKLDLPKPIVSDVTRRKISEKAVGRKHTEETKQKISESYKRYLEDHPEMVGFVMNHSSKKSYPESYFEELFSNENIPLMYHKRVGRYELDFYNEDLKIYIEIDGSQHDSEYMITHDKERDKYLMDRGWIGMRIKWSEYMSLDESGRKNVVSEIRKFIKSNSLESRIGDLPE